MDNLPSRYNVKWEALGFIFAATLAVTVPIIGSACFIKWLYYPSQQAASAHTSGKKGAQVSVALPQDDREEFSRSDLITVILSAVSVVLTAVAIGLAILGIFGYKAMKESAELAARRIAEEVARQRTEEIIPNEVETFLKTSRSVSCKNDCDAEADSFAKNS